MQLNDLEKLLTSVVENELRFRALMDILKEKDITNYDELNLKLKEEYSNSDIRIDIVKKIIS